MSTRGGPLVAQSQQPTLNLVILGDSLTEGVPHLNGYREHISLYGPVTSFLKFRISSSVGGKRVSHL